MGVTQIYVEQDGKKMLHKQTYRFDMKSMQKFAVGEYGKPNSIKYKSRLNRMLVYDNKNIHIVFDDTVVY